MKRVLKVLLTLENLEKAAFVTLDGLQEFLLLAFGLNSPLAKLQLLMNTVLAGLKWNMCWVYLEAALVFGLTLEAHLKRQNQVLTALRAHGQNFEFE